MEEGLARRLHKAVGGCPALSAIDSPVAARAAVLVALAAQQTDTEAARRIERGILTPLERRVVRTVTNRGAAVRSRVRQRREVARLRDELRRKDDQIRRLEAAIKAITPPVASSWDTVNAEKQLFGNLIDQVISQ